MRRKPKSSLEFIILGLIPYTRPNLLLAFKPHQFFNELERLSGIPKENLKKTYTHAKRRGLISHSPDSTALSLKARQIAEPFIAAQLPNARLMIIFDIPEAHRAQGRIFRRILRQLGCTQVQRSVWMTPRDYRVVLRETIDDLGLGRFVNMYAAEELT